MRGAENRTKVLVAADSALARAGLEAVVREASAMLRLAGPATDLSSAIREVEDGTGRGGVAGGAGRPPGGGRGGGGGGGGSAPGGAGGGRPRGPLGGRRGGWEGPLRALLGPQGSASSGRGGGVRTTGQGTGTAWSREPRSPPSVGTTWRSQKGLAFGLKALTAPPLC